MHYNLVRMQALSEKNSREFKILAAALFIAVLAVTLLASLVFALQSIIQKDATQLLGAQVLIESAEPIHPNFEKEAGYLQLEYSKVTEFLSMLSFAQKYQLTNIIAVHETYPLVGQLEIVTKKGTEKRNTPPLKKTIWLAENLADILKVQLGDKITFGNTTLTVDAIIKKMPVATGTGNIFAPTAIVNAQSLAEAQVLLPGSRASYYLLIAGDKAKIRDYQQYFEENNTQELTWISSATGRRALNRTIGLAQKYVAIVLLIQVMLAAIAIAICAHQYSIRQQFSIAIWRTLGATSAHIFKVQVIALFGLAFLVMLTAIASGYAGAQLLSRYSLQFGIELQSVGWQGSALGLATGIIVLIGFVLPPLLELKKITAIQILKKKVSFSPKLGASSYLAGLLALIMLYYFSMGQNEIVLRFFAQSFVALVVVYCITWVLWSGLIPISKKGPLSWRLALSYLIRHKWQVIIQWLVFTLVLMLLMLVHILQRDFLNTWRNELPENTPNYFLINIQNHQIEDLNQWFNKHWVQNIEFYPIVRGRMEAVNGIKVKSPQSKSKGLNRAINLTWLESIPMDNEILQGNWSSSYSNQAVISIEENFAQRQNLQLNDSVTFNIDAQKITAKVVQIRRATWENFKPNFYVIFPKGMLDDFPHTYITSIYVPTHQRTIMVDFAERYPEISLIDIETILSEIKSIIQKLTTVFNILFAVVFLLGVLIMYANILATLKSRLKEGSLMQILGAKKRLIANIVAIEYLILGALAAVLASVFAYAIAFDLAHRYFDIRLTIDWIGLVVMIGLSSLTIVLFGLLGCLPLFKASPLWLFRKS